MKQRFSSVWDAIEDTKEEAENMRLRSLLMMVLKKRIEGEALSQASAAKMLGVTQPRVSDLLRGKINLFALDALVNMVAASGFKIEVKVTKTRAPAKTSRATSNDVHHVAEHA
jgi:predicted XRE-type DNA-binding protein